MKRLYGCIVALDEYNDIPDKFAVINPIVDNIHKAIKERKFEFNIDVGPIPFAEDLPKTFEALNAYVLKNINSIPIKNRKCFEYCYDCCLSLINLSFIFNYFCQNLGII